MNAADVLLAARDDNLETEIAQRTNDLTDNARDPL